MRRLLIRPGAIGDVILSLPSLLAARAAKTEVWVPSAVVSLVKAAGFKLVWPISATGLDLVGVRRTATACPRLGEFDEIISWYGTGQPAFREAVGGLPFQFHDALPPASGAIHAADFFARQIGSTVRAEPRIPIQCRRGSYIVIHPFSGSPRKNWPLARFHELEGMLPLPVRWTAGPEDPLAGARRFDDLINLARFLGSATLYVGNDSGITHLAAAVGTPTVAIFGPTDPAVWAPRGNHVRIVRQSDSEGLDRLEAREV
ncbi:MAG: glycosyltransferase family 9 protein, partial [Bryobacteraceae bacterium]